MKQIATLFTFLILFSPVAKSQYSNSFETYPVNQYLGLNYDGWTTWSNAPGSSEDVPVVNTDAYTGSQSIYFFSNKGSGPQDVVLPFGGVYNSGRFKFSAKFKVPSGKSAYFNFQAGASVGQTWAFELYMHSNGTLDVKTISASYPQGQWFELTVDVDLTNNNWKFYIDKTLIGSFSNTSNAISYLDIYSAEPNTEFWVDDVQYCINSACDPDLSMENLIIDPNPLCSGKGADVTLKVKNNGPVPAEDMVLGLDMSGQNRISYPISFGKGGLAVGRDTTLYFTSLFKTGITGSNLKVKGINVKKDSKASNDTFTTTVTVLASPNGAYLMQGASFQGQFKMGDIAQPDVAEVGKLNSYELVPPKGYTNAGYSTTWDIVSVSAATTSGKSVPSSYFGYSIPSSGNNASLTFTGHKDYLDSTLVFYITFRNLPNNCDSTVKRVIHIAPTPKTNFSFPSTICLGDDVAFNNLSTVHSGTAIYMWYFGTPDNDSSDMISPSFHYQSAGTYNVRLVAKSIPWNVVKDTTIKLTVNEIPKVKFDIVNNCFGVAVQMQNKTTVAGGNPLTYDWGFGDGSPHVSTVNASRTYAAAGAYKVTLKATAGGCSNTLSKNAYTFARPVANFTAPASSVCATTAIDFINTTTIASGFSSGSYWYFGDGNKTIAGNASHAYAIPGSYDVKLVTVSEFNCMDSITKTVNVIASPSPAFTTDKLCSREMTAFNNTTAEVISNPTYKWTFSDGMTSSSKNITRSWPNEGTYTVTLDATYGNGCSASVTKTMDVLIQPKASFTVNKICAGQTADFINTSEGNKDGVQYAWQFGDGDNSTEWSPSHFYTNTATTTYTVKLRSYYPDGCDDTAHESVTVYQSPVCDFTSVHRGFSKYGFLPANTSYVKYEWHFGDGGASAQVSPDYQYTSGGNFRVTLKAENAEGCMCEKMQIISSATGINALSFDDESIRMYPNPSAGIFTLSNSSNSPMAIAVYTLLGDMVYSNSSEKGNALINMEGHADGIYLVKVTVNGTTSTGRLNLSR